MKIKVSFDNYPGDMGVTYNSIKGEGTFYINIKDGCADGTFVDD